MAVWLVDVPLQAVAILYKAFLMMYRRWVATAIRFLIPILCVLACWILIFVYAQPNLVHPSTSTMNTVPKCTVGKGKNSCTTLVYRTDVGFPKEVADDIMDILCDLNKPKLDCSKDVKYSSLSQQDLLLDLYAKSNTTLGGISFQTIEMQPNTTDTPIHITYTAIFNNTYVPQKTMIMNKNNIFETNIRLNLVRSVDAAVINYVGKQQDPSLDTKVEVQRKKFPDTGFATQVNYVILNQLQIVFYYVAFTLGSLFCLTSIVKEKMQGMRGYLKLLGLHDSSFWIATFIEQGIYLLVPAAIALSMGKLLPDLPFFSECDLSVLLVIFLTYTALMLVMATLLSTVIGQTKFANVFGGLYFLIGIALALFWSITDTGAYILWRSRLGGWFSVFPPFLFLKLMMDIKTRTVGPAYTNIFLNNSFNATNGFSWGDMFDPLPIYKSSSSTSKGTVVPTTWDSVVYMLIECSIFFALTIWADICFGSKHKSGNPPWYFLLPSYWRCGGGSVEEEQQGLADSDRVALRVRNMSKDYKKGFFKTGAVSALRPFSLEINSSTVFCMLGHNGAGKTTAINCFIGLQQPTDGDAIIFGKNIVTQSSEIHDMMGVCPQFDMLWDDLTAYEHMWICNSLKRSHDRNSKEELEDKLFRVRLQKHSNHQTKTFSGGMKRRLSFIISTIGNPRVIFLDEPTTGMDPGNRNFVWDMIKEIKMNKLIILTTHSMEEADMLGDRIAIMAQGKLRAEGNSLSLKRQFGSGYRVNISCEVEFLDEVKANVSRILPGAQLVAENAGSLVYGLPDVDPDGSTARFFKYLQDKDATRGLINDWGIHNTSLEDVFMTITRKIMGQDVSFVNVNKQSKRDQDERAYFRETTRRMQLRINHLEAYTEDLLEALRMHGIEAPTPRTLAAVEEDDVYDGTVDDAVCIE